MSLFASSRSRGTGSRGLQVLLVIGFGLGAAAVVLVFAFVDQVRWLRYAVMLALWSALFAAFAAARSRREAQLTAARENELTRTYQLELHREVVARREFEAGVAEDRRAVADARDRTELTAVREQLNRLTATLSALVEGDVLFERMTLSAEATRVRSRSDAGREVVAGSLVPELAAPTASFIPAQTRSETDGDGRAVAGPAPADSADRTDRADRTDGPDDLDGADRMDDADDGRVSAAELLAAFGAPVGGGRRRRRAAD